jgi:hypothetical protein
MQCELVRERNLRHVFGRDASRVALSLAWDARAAGDRALEGSFTRSAIRLCRVDQEVE